VQEIALIGRTAVGNIIVINALLGEPGPVEVAEASPALEAVASVVVRYKYAPSSSHGGSRIKACVYFLDEADIRPVIQQHVNDFMEYYISIDNTQLLREELLKSPKKRTNKDTNKNTHTDTSFNGTELQTK
jgi:hypothetical protein